ncbi:porin family protein [Pseudozobellia thermophila]|uniref:Outer membrane protein beta-barrel domain-containing protein n=1 Tax=Pseudozobellia thermophila TaxID=192903 RepID=A0A1M6MJF7_9FLAO|nr:porin family protein [Pseudozobellia thermophila]SHJ83625.1 Outer membrane protein beta-barrel domain-containing protein [Pseudozobellia thermophila]
MKIKYSVVLAFVFLGYVQLNAQTVIQGTGPSGNSVGDINFGAKAGLNMATWMGKDLDGVSAKPGAYFGGIAEIPAFIDDFYFQPELLVSFVGADLGPVNANLTYLTLPMMAKYHIMDEVAVEFGPQVGFLLSDNWEEDLQGQDTKKMDLGLNIGGGYRLNENLYFQLRFSVGVGKVLDVSKVHNGVLSVGACYFL